MNIQSTQNNIRLDRPKAKQAYMQAEKDRQTAEKKHLKTAQDDFVKSNKYGIAAGLGTGLALGGAVAAYTLLGGAHSGFEVGLASALVGVSLGGIAWAVTGEYMNSVGRKQREQTTLPKLRQSTEELVVARENYRNSLLQELDDEGVVDATQAGWESLKRKEVKGADFGREARVNLSTQLGYLEEMADARQADGWLKKMANLEDNPEALHQQREAIAAHPTLQKMVECNNGA